MMNSLIAENFNLLAANPIEKVIDHVQFGSGGFFSLTNHMILLCATSVIMLLLIPLVAAAYKFRLVPKGFQNAIEAVLLYIRDQVVRPILGKEGDTFLPFIWTMFFFILINNLIGLLPLYDLTTYFLKKPLGLAHPIYGTATGNLAVTAALAVITFVVIQAYGLKELGVNGYLAHLTAGTPKFIWPIIVPVEILGMFVKPFALMMRLFANMLAGGIVLKVLVGFVAMAADLGPIGQTFIGIPVVIGSTAMMLLKVFVAFLQAYLFVFLTTIFLSQMQHHHDDEHGHEHGHDDHSDSPETKPAVAH
jgi:F-type H+-transporting ATPase subunit a